MSLTTHDREMARAAAKRATEPAEAPSIRVTVISDNNHPQRFRLRVRCSFGPNFTVSTHSKGESYFWLSPCCAGEIRHDRTRACDICLVCRGKVPLLARHGNWDQASYRASLNHHLDALEAELVHNALQEAVGDVLTRARGAAIMPGHKVYLIHLDAGKPHRWG